MARGRPAKQIATAPMRSTCSLAQARAKNGPAEARRERPVCAAKTPLNRHFGRPPLNIQSLRRPFWQPRLGGRLVSAQWHSKTFPAASSLFIYSYVIIRHMSCVWHAVCSWGGDFPWSTRPAANRPPEGRRAWRGGGKGPRRLTQLRKEAMRMTSKSGKRTVNRYFADAAASRYG